MDNINFDLSQNPVYFFCYCIPNDFQGFNIWLNGVVFTILCDMSVFTNAAMTIGVYSKQ